jgi:hypothetical protein
MTDKQKKIFGIGLPRTGTTTLTKCLDMLGFGPAGHFVYVHTDGRRFEEILEPYGALADLPMAYLALNHLDELLDAFPDALFINTTRPVEAYLKSCRFLFYADEHPFPGDKPAWWTGDFDEELWSDFREMRRQSLGAVAYDEDAYRKFYWLHQEKVEQLSSRLSGRLLNYDVTAGKWEPLCEFLQVDVPAEPFPRSNATKPIYQNPAFSRIREYVRARPKLRKILSSAKSLAQSK